MREEARRARTHDASDARNLPAASFAAHHWERTGGTPRLDQHVVDDGTLFVDDAQLAKGSLWWLTWRDDDAVPVVELLARSHPHGRWLQWLARA